MEPALISEREICKMNGGSCEPPLGFGVQLAVASFELMGGDGLFAEGVEFGAVGGAGVEHVAAGEFVHGELWRDGGGELVLS
jgi:hypothetical protein